MTAQVLGDGWVILLFWSCENIFLERLAFFGQGHALRYIILCLLFAAFDFSIRLVHDKSK
jgi:integral membrane sensor domain MASE1